jgi:putative intracellular protease/amidase
MTRFGYTLMTEQNGPKDLVRYAISAEHRGFDFAGGGRDHFSPWLASQGVVVDGNLVTSRSPSDLLANCSTIVEQLVMRRQAPSRLRWPIRFRDRGLWA